MHSGYHKCYTTALNAMHSRPTQVEKEKEALRLELDKTKTNLADAESAIGTQKAQLEKLNHVVAEADAGVQTAADLAAAAQDEQSASAHPLAASTNAIKLGV
jgi:chromosome segregation ATPase